MAVGRDALLSHGAAAVLWGLVGEPPEPFDVTTIRRNRHGPAGIVLHRPRHPPDAARRRGVPVTTVPQTLLDVASTVIERTLERAIREAHARWLVRRLTLLAFVDQAAGLPGAPALREALGRSGATRSAAERAFLRLCRRERLELPLVNVSVAGEDVDFFWPQHDLVVETDGYATYATRDGFEHDRRLDATLARAGTRVQRFTWRQLDARPREVAETLSALGVLKAGRPPAGAGPMLDVDATLRTLISVEGSDLQLKVNAPPLARIHGRLGPREGDYNVLGQQDTEAAVHHMLKDPNKLEEFKREGEVDFAYAVAGLARFRVNAFRQRGSISLACRAIPFSVRSIEDLNLPRAVRDLAERGIVLLTGVTGSGKSTTLAAMVNHINQNQAKHIVTIEDPVEYLHRDKQSVINQREVGEDTLSFQRPCAACCVRTPT